MIAILLCEVLLIVKFGGDVIRQSPPTYVAHVWLGCLLLTIAYCVYYFGIAAFWSQRTSMHMELDSDCDSVVSFRRYFLDRIT